MELDGEPLSSVVTAVDDGVVTLGSNKRDVTQVALHPLVLAVE